MTTSGTYTFGDTPVDDIILDAFERCGILGPIVTGEQVKAAQRSLNLMFSEWVNRGLRLWTIQQGMITISPGQPFYQLPQACIDVLELTRAVTTRQLNGTPFSSAGGTAEFAFDDNAATACTQTAPNGYISYDYGVDTVKCITYVGIQSNTTTDYTLEIEYSYDNVNWITAFSPGIQNYYKGQKVWWVLQAPVNARAWRIRETGGATLSIQELYFDVPNYSTLMSRISRSDYAAIPNKLQRSAPSSYYVDRTVIPTLTIWPTPDSSYRYLIFNYMRQIQDVSELVQTINAPQRFLDAVAAGLAARLALKFAPDRYDTLAAIAQEAYLSASYEDRERVPMRIQLNDWPT